MKAPKITSVREIALRLLDEGRTCAEVATTLRIPVQAVAAWKAHRTMGTYNKPKKEAK